MKNVRFQNSILLPGFSNFQLQRNLRLIQELSNNPVVRQTTTKKGCEHLKSPIDLLGNSHGMLFSLPKEVAKQHAN